MTITTIDQTTIDHRLHADAEEDPGVVGRERDEGAPRRCRNRCRRAPACRRRCAPAQRSELCI